jgi:hypothetical protein
MSRAFVLAALFALVALCTAAPASRQLSEPSSGWSEYDWTPDVGFAGVDDALDQVETTIKEIFTQVSMVLSGLGDTINVAFDELAAFLWALVSSAGAQLAPLVDLIEMLAQFGNN